MSKQVARSKYYVNSLAKKVLGEKRKRTKSFLKEDGGLLSWIRQNEVLKLRVRVESPEDFQVMLDEGKSFIYYKYRVQDQRWHSTLEISSENTVINGYSMVYRGNARPFSQTGSLRSTDTYSLDSFIVEVIESVEDLEAKKAANAVMQQVTRRRNTINPYTSR